MSGITGGKPTPIAAMDRKIELYSVTQSANAYNEKVETVTSIGQVWAKVEENKGVERPEAARETSIQSKIFTIRWRAGITTSHRIQYQSAWYDITSVQEEGRQWQLAISADLRV